MENHIMLYILLLLTFWVVTLIIVEYYYDLRYAVYRFYDKLIRLFSTNRYTKSFK